MASSSGLSSLAASVPASNVMGSISCMRLGSKAVFQKIACIILIVKTSNANPIIRVTPTHALSSLLVLGLRSAEIILL